MNKIDFENLRSQVVISNLNIELERIEYELKVKFINPKSYIFIMIQNAQIDYNKLTEMIRQVVREELDEIRYLNPEYIKELQKLEKEKGIKFTSIKELDNLIKNA